jgi:hypothetical protein
MFTQPFYTMDIFPYGDAITIWNNEKSRRGFLVWCFLVVVAHCFDHGKF